MGLDGGKPVFRGLQTTKLQTTPLSLVYWKVSYINLLQVKFQFSS